MSTDDRSVETAAEQALADYLDRRKQLKERLVARDDAEADYGRDNDRAERWLSSRQRPELAALCERRGLDNTGSEEELVRRLMARDAAAAVPGADMSLGEAAKLAIQNKGRAEGSICNDRLRDSLDWQGRCALAEELKGAGNQQLREGQPDAATSSYLAAIWLLKPSDPLSPNVLDGTIWQLRPDDALRPHPLPEPRTVSGHDGVLILGEGYGDANGAERAAAVAQGAAEEGTATEGTADEGAADEDAAADGAAPEATGTEAT
eukprot:4383137-Prymnesium_polylepis.1